MNVRSSLLIIQLIDNISLFVLTELSDLDSFHLMNAGVYIFDRFLDCIDGFIVKVYFVALSADPRWYVIYQ
jgi:hypothetical protein